MHWTELGIAALAWTGIGLALAILTGVEFFMKSHRMRRSSLRGMKIAAMFLRWLLVVVIFSILIVALGPLRHLVLTPFQHSGATPSLTDASIKTDIDELKWMLTVLAGFAVITALAQAAAAWVSALTYDKQATAKLQEIDKVLESFKARFPVFHEVEDKRNLAHDALVATLRRVFDCDDEDADPTEAITWMKDFYHELTVETRQLLLSVESFASIDLHPAHKGSEVQNLKLFAVFYHAKFLYEKNMHAAALFTDLERAEGYLLLALHKSPADFTLYNELGNIYITMWEATGRLPRPYPDYLEKAKKAVNDSLEWQARQQRANYNLAYIRSMHDKDYDAARKLLEKALKYKVWQKLPTPAPLAAYVHYNLACNWARVIARDHTGSSPIGLAEAESVTASLQKAANSGNIAKTYVESDYTDKDQGDIFGLLQKADQPLQAELERLKLALTTERPKPSPEGFWETIARAFSNLSKKVRPRSD